MTRRTIAELLASARARIDRLDPQQAVGAIAEGALLLDIRSEPQRARDGVVPGAYWHPRNVLEWRLDPASESADPVLARLDARIVVMCDEGYQSSLAAATLRDLGFTRTADLAGGFQAWRRAGLPVDGGAAEEAPSAAKSGT